MIRDDRGATARAPSADVADPTKDHGLLPPEEQSILAVILQARIAKNYPPLLAGTPLVTGLGGTFVARAISAHLPGWLSMAVYVSVGFVGASVYGALLKRWQRAQLPRLLVDRGYCGSCAYPLRRVEAAGDGCRVCPECGGAWRVPAPGETPTDHEFETLEAKATHVPRKVRDATRKAVPLLPASSLLPTGHASPIPLAARSAICERWSRRVAPRQRAIANLIRFTLYACIVAMIGLEASAATRSLVVVAEVATISILIGASFVLTPLRAPWWRRLAHFMAAEGYCPSCGAAISGVERRPDGLVACPGCPGVWRRGEPLP